jgi:hypothetical protein
MMMMNLIMSMCMHYFCFSHFWAAFIHPVVSAVGRISLFAVVSDVLLDSLAAGKMSQIICEVGRNGGKKESLFGSNVKENEDIAGVDGGGVGDFPPEKKWPRFKMIRSTRRVIKASFRLFFSFMTGD